MTSIRSVKGSALVETSVLMVVMLPLIFALTMVGDLIDLNQNMEQVARYTSWETTVESNSSNSLSDIRVQERFFSAPDAPISTEPQGRSSNSLWGEIHRSNGHMQSETAVILDQSSVAVHLTKNITASTAAMKISQAAARSGEFLDGVSGNSWGLSSGGPSSVSVEARIKSIPWLPAGSSECSGGESYICLNSRAVILSDGWSASNDTHAEQRVRSLMPASVLEPVGDAVSVVGNLPMFHELKNLRGAFGHVDMQVLPEYLD